MEITIPTKWSDVTIGNYINLRPVLNSKLNPIERVVNILAVLTGQKRDVIKNISLKQYKSIKEKMSFLDTELPNKLKDKRFKIGGQWYEFKIDAKKLLFGEYINSMEILQNAKDDEDAIFNNLHHILTTICRPVKRTLFGWKHIKVDSEILRKTADNFLNNMPITIAYPIGVFFYNHLPNLTQDIKTSLIQTAKKKIQEAKEIVSQKTGDGSL